MKRAYLGILLIFNLLAGLFLGAQLLAIFPLDSTAPRPASDTPPALLSPANHITEDQIHVADGYVTITLDGFQTGWARFAPTASMDPVLRDGHNSIEITPRTEADIHVGDIISFYYPSRTAAAPTLIVHRVIDTGIDDNGWYAITKGDNNPTPDPGKRRFNDIVGIAVVLIY